MTQVLVAERRRTPRRLGEVLVLRGLVAEDEVTSALLEQRRSGRRIGQILLARGTISPSDLFSALAEQTNGGILCEHGFGTGLRRAIAGSCDRRHEVQIESPAAYVSVAYEDAGGSDGFGSGLRKRLAA
jgi:hypothetical protein